MKTTMEIPDDVFREAKTFAAAHGLTLKELMTGALEDWLRRVKSVPERGERPWMAGFGGLAHLRGESARISELIEAEFERIEPEDAV